MHTYNLFLQITNLIMAKFSNKIMLSENKHVFDKLSKLTPVLSKQYLITFTNKRLQQFWQFWMYVKIDLTDSLRLRSWLFITKEFRRSLIWVLGITAQKTCVITFLNWTIQNNNLVFFTILIGIHVIVINLSYKFAASTQRVEANTVKINLFIY